MAGVKIKSNAAINNIAKDVKFNIYSNFVNLFPFLSSLLDDIKNAPSKDAATAYGEAMSGKFEYGKGPDGKVKVGEDGKPSDVKIVQDGAKTLIEGLVATLTSKEIDYMSGLKFTDVSDDEKKRKDVVNSALSHWDASASKYMKQDRKGGDEAREAFRKRLYDYDTAIVSSGKTPIKPDE